MFDRDTSVDASVRMFEDPGVESVALEFHEGYDVVDGTEPETWRIENLRATLTVKRAADDAPRTAPLCVTLYVRAVDGDVPAYQVYREVFFEGDGCVGK